jgi:hypothetical protein
MIAAGLATTALAIVASFLVVAAIVAIVIWASKG